MKSFILGFMLVLAASPAFAAGRCRNGSCKVQQTQVSKVYSIPTTGKSTYTGGHSAVAKPSCKDGKCRLSK